ADGYAHEGKTITQMMEEDHPDSFQGYFHNVEHAETLGAEYTRLVSARIVGTITPAAMADIPTTPQQKREWLVRIFDAIRDFTNVTNRPRSNRVNTVQHENTHVVRVRQMKGAATELVAHKILNLAINAQTGNVGMPAWVHRKSWTYKRFPTFAERMEHILHGLRVNKSIAHTFISVDPSRRWVANPQSELKSNMTGNDEKKSLINDGREARQNQ
ncbi:hypothetical protein B0T20DRAFT_338392, partial [Sordaria brevicollis]